MKIKTPFCFALFLSGMAPILSATATEQEDAVLTNLIPLGPSIVCDTSYLKEGESMDCAGAIITQGPITFSPGLTGSFTSTDTIIPIGLIDSNEMSSDSGFSSNSSSVSAVAHTAHGVAGQNTGVAGSHGAATVNGNGDGWYYTFTDKISVLNGTKYATNTKTVKIPQGASYVHRGASLVRYHFSTPGVFQSRATTTISDGAFASNTGLVYIR